MRRLRFSTLLILAMLAGCARREVPISTLPPPPATAPERALVETPPPAAIPEPPLPELKPGTGPDLARSEALMEAASPKGPPVEANGTPGGEAGQPAAGPAASQLAASTEGASPAAPSEEPRPPDIDHLVGLSESDATKAFGPPTERKEVPPSRVWTYRSQLCDLKLFFYPEVGGSAYRALTYQIDDRGANDANHHTCLTSLAKPHAG